MDNGIYIALSRQLALFRDMAVTANNIANINTAGYQSSHMMFHSYLVKNKGDDDMAFANDISTYRNLDYGSSATTGNALDVAIKGDGYFMVGTPLGERFTRSGNFQVDAAGTIVTSEGYPVLDQNGQPITLPENATNVVIGSIGNITVDGQDLSTLGVFTFENQQLMERVGDRMYASDVPPQAAENFVVAQGMLENSNTTPVKEMTHMIEVSRAVASTAKYIEAMYDMQRKHTAAWTRSA